MPDVRTDIASLLLERVGDQHLGLRTRDRDWTWDEVVAESAARGALAEAMRVDGPLHVGVLLDNVPDFLFWLGVPRWSGRPSSGSTRPGAPPSWQPKSGLPIAN